MSNVTYLNPEELIPQLFEFEGVEIKDFRLGHIKYDENLDNEYDYQIIRSSSHDGTLIFTMQNIGRTLEPLVNRTTYCKKDLTEDQLQDIEDIEYTVGNIKVESEYGIVDVPAGKIPGVTETSINSCSLQIYIQNTINELFHLRE